MAKYKTRVLKPKYCEKILNYNGFYPERQEGNHILFCDDIGREILIKRGETNPYFWKKIIKEFNLVEPSKIY